MSEGRQLTLLLVGLLVLGVLGFGGAALFPDECRGLERRGALALRYEGASDALGLDEALAVRLQSLGDAAGMGEFRGAVVVPDDARLLPAEAEFFLVTDREFAVLRPGFGVVSNARERDREQVVPAHRALALVAEDGTTVLYDGELDDLRCGELVEPSRVLDVDRGVSIVRDGAATAAVTLSGEQLWSVDLGARATWAWVVDRTVLVGTTERVVEVSLPDGALLREVLDTPVDLVDARQDAVLARDAQSLLVTLDAGASGATGLELDGTAPAALTPAGVVQVATDGAALVARTPSGEARVDEVDLIVEQLVTADDGMVAVLVERDGVRAVLQWGPVPTADGAG